MGLSGAARGINALSWPKLIGWTAEVTPFVRSLCCRILHNNAQQLLKTIGFCCNITKKLQIKAPDTSGVRR